jgi:polyisoprenoid-binding protein YceI
VDTLDVGAAGWSAAGLPLEGTAKLPLPMLLEGTFVVDTTSSVLRWTGRNLFNYHRGTLGLRDGQITFSSSKASSALFSIEMSTLACEDITDKTMNAMLIHHLHDEDFFDVAHFPTATFKGTKIEPLETSTEGSDNYRVEGELTVRGITLPILSTAVLALNGDHVTAQTTMDIDRTAFGSHYGSGKFFRFLGKHVVNDHVQLHLILHADRKGP